MVKLELLAPAKDFDHGQAAINHGADAVYIGAPRFSARKAAGTDIHQIKALAKYAHLYSAKVYVAMNTILYDSELDEVRQLIHEIYEAGVDALIVQDMGILEMDLPPLPLFASTQTHNSTPEKVLFLEKVGFKRVILARELTINEIAEIHQKCKVELESFVHGALCVSYSGQCYMSQSVCNRSGNRGECAQPCRSAYDLVDAKGNLLVKNKHLLSLKDLNLSLHIPELIEAGITSFKIEGRLKDMAYIKNVVSHYRNCIDNYLSDHPGYSKASSGKCFHGFTPDPNKTYNRGYTNYNIHGREEKLSTYHTQKAVGTKVGTIVRMNGKTITYTGEQLQPGDGICFFSKSEELKGFYVNKAEGNLLIPSNTDALFEGAILYRNFDKKFEDQLNLPGIRKIQVMLQLSGKENELQLILTDEDGYQITCSKALTITEADNQEKAETLLKNQLMKMGNSPFVVIELDIRLEKMPFLPVSQINELRREATEMLILERNRKYAREELITEPNNFPFPQTILSYEANISNRLSERFYRRHGVEKTEPAYELRKEPHAVALMVTKHCIRYQLDACPALSHHKNKLNLPLYLVDQKNKYQLKFDCLQCKMIIYNNFC